MSGQPPVVVNRLFVPIRVMIATRALADAAKENR